MPTNRSDVAYGYWRDSSEKFDYFVTGVTGALAAYIGQTLQPFRVGANPQTVELVALGLLVGSALVGLRRIEASVTLYGLQHQRLYSEEARGSLVHASQRELSINVETGVILDARQALAEARRHESAAPNIQKEIEDVSKNASSLYRARNRLLLLGFAALVVARILPAYMH